MKGDVVHEWKLPAMAGNYAYLLPNGNLLVAQRTKEGPADLPGKGGKLIEMDWDSNILWEFIDKFQKYNNQVPYRMSGKVPIYVQSAQYTVHCD